MIFLFQVSDTKDEPLQDTETSFALNLNGFAWIPAQITKYEYEFGTEKSTSFDYEVLRPPQGVYMRTKEITQLLSTHVPFIAAEVSNQSKLCKYLGVRTEVDVGDLERLLIRWSKREKEEAETFTTSLVHMNHVYKHLQENLPPKRLQELLQNHPVIFVPDDDPSEPLRSPTDEFVRGKFYNREEVIWGDPTGMCLKYKKLLNDPELDKGQRRLLEYVYPNLEDIFRRGALVAETPNTKEYLDLLEAITQHFTPYSRLLDILAIFTQFGRLLADEQVNDVLEQVPLRYIISTHPLSARNIHWKSKFSMTTPNWQGEWFWLHMWVK